MEHAQAAVPAGSVLPWPVAPCAAVFGREAGGGASFRWRTAEGGALCLLSGVSKLDWIHVGTASRSKLPGLGWPAGSPKQHLWSSFENGIVISHLDVI